MDDWRPFTAEEARAWCEREERERSEARAGGERSEGERDEGEHGPEGGYPTPASADYWWRGYARGFETGQQVAGSWGRSVCPTCGHCVQDAGVVACNNMGEEAAFVAGYARGRFGQGERGAYAAYVTWVQRRGQEAEAGEAESSRE